MKPTEDNWLYTISAKNRLITLNFQEIWRYRDLLMLFVRRDVVTVYKQTVLGPLWYLIQPLFTSVVFTLVFNNLGQIQTGEVPAFLFNLAGITSWNYFKECLTGTSNTFTKNQNIFGKVYFPRVIMPMSVTISNLLKFSIQLAIFIGFYCFYLYQGSSVTSNVYILLFPVYVLLMAFLGLGFGMIISALTTKYRDLHILVGFGVQLLMFISAVPYPLSEARSKFPELVVPIVEYNPMTQIIEGLRFIMLNSGTFTWGSFIYVCLISALIFLVGLVIFNRTEKQFIDTV